MLLIFIENLFFFSNVSSFQQSNRPIWGACPILSTEELEDNRIVTVYLSNANELTISGITSNVETQVSIFNMLGKEVGNYRLNNTSLKNTIQLNHFETGIYFVKVKAGTSLHLQKIFIE